MPMGSAAHDEARRAAIVLGFYQYTRGWSPLYRVVDDTGEMASLFTDYGYEHVLAHLQKGGFAHRVRADLERWLLDVDNPYDEVVIYWAGHGHIEGGHYLIAADSPMSQLTDKNAVAATSLATLIAKSPVRRLTLIIDACYAGMAADKVSAELSEILGAANTEPDRFTAIITSARTEEVPDGAFCAAALEVLRSGPPDGIDDAFTWTDHDRFIHPEALATAVDQVFGDPSRAVDARTSYRSIGKVGRRIPNPRWREGLPARPVDEARADRRALSRRDRAEHFGPKSRGVDVGDSGWLFSGRVDVLRAAATWLRTADSGYFVVTGSPGSGKSSVVGRLATLADEEYRALAATEAVIELAAAGTVPDPGSFDLVIHAKSLGLDDVAERIATRFDLTVDQVTDPASLVAAFGARAGRTTVLLDALDEAAGDAMTAIATNLLRPLARVPGARIMVGTRRTRDAFATIDDLDGPGPLIRALAAGEEEVHDLDREPATLDDIEEYVVGRLLDGSADSPFNGESELAQGVAEELTRRTGGSFLAARLLSRLVRDRGPKWIRGNPKWADGLGEGLYDALAGDLDRFAEPDRTRVRELLWPLAWAQGAGLPRDGVWPEVATELSKRFGSGSGYVDDDISWLLRTAGYHVLEAGEDDRTVYRLYHQFYGDFLRKEMLDADRS